MNKESFLDLLDRYQQNNCSAEEELFVEEWYDSLNSDHRSGLSPVELSSINERILVKLQANLQQRTRLQAHLHPSPERPLKSIPLNRRYKIGIAASVTIAFVFAAFYTLNYNNAERAFKNENAASELLSTRNTSDSLLRVSLSDHSIVTLQPKATITYPAQFNGTSRNVYLKGDAFFEVSKNPRRPFYVYNNKLKVKVLGTSFSINEVQAQVSVKTGKVAVNENHNQALFTFRNKKESKGVLLTPNQKAVFDAGKHQIRKTLVDRPLPLPIQGQEPETADFKFSETRLQEVFSTLSKAYGIVIQLEDEGVNDCTFTGDIDKKCLYDQLNLICESITGSYHVDGTTIFIKAKRCN